MIEVRTLGEATIQVAGNVVTPESQVLFALALYLATSRGQPIARTELIALLWPDCTERSGRHRLRQAIYQLRRLGVRMTVTSVQIELAEETVYIDYAAPPAQRREVIERVSTHAPIRFLPNYAPTLSEGFSRWLEARRDYVHRVVRKDLHAALIARCDAGDSATVVRLARAYLELDPFDREATFALAEAYASRGDGAEAVALLDHYRTEIIAADSEAARATTALQRRIARAIRSSAIRGAHRTDLVGRDDFVRLLERWVARNGPVESAVGLWGEAGIGKTRLLLEATRLATVRGIRSVSYRPGANGEDRPLAGIFELLPRLLELPGAVGCSPESFTRLSNLARGVDEHRTIPEDTPDSTFRYAALRRAIFDLVEAISAEGDVLLTVDDVHWLDAPSLTILLDAARDDRNKLRVLCAFRPGAASVLLGNQPDVALMRVPKLDADAARAIVTRDLGPELIAERSRLVDWAIDLADGNPFFLIELSTHCRGANPDESLPESLQVSIQRKLGGLSETALLVVQACATLGHCSTLERIETMLALPPHALARGLAELEGLGLIDTREARLACRHDLIADEVARGLGAVLAAYLHSRCATVLETEMQSVPSPMLAWECARHWEAAGQPDRAFAKTMQIADQLLALGLPTAVVDLCTRAERYSRTLSQRAARLLRLRHARRLLCDWDGVIDAVSQKARVADRGYPLGRYSDDEIALFEARWYRDYDSRILKSAIVRLRDNRAPALHRLQMAVIALMVADNYQRKEIAQRIAAETEMIVPESNAERVEAAKARLIYHTGFGDLEVGLAAGSELLRILRPSGVSAMLLRSLRWASMPMKLANRVDDAIEALTESYAHARRLDLKSEMAFTAEEIVDVYIECEDVEGASEWGEVCDKLTRQRGSLAALVSTQAVFIQAHVAFLRGDVDMAATLLADARSLAFAQNHPRALESLLALDAIVRLRSASGSVPANLVASLRRLHLRIRDSGTRDFETGALLSALIATGESDEARRLHDQYFARRRRRLPVHSVLREASQTLASIPVTTH